MKTRILKFRVNEDQYDRLKDVAIMKGFETISSYIRYIALDKDFIYEKMLTEIHNEVVKNGRT